MKQIPLTKGYVALVDDEDFDWLSQWSWCYAKGYAVRGERVGGRQRLVKMHREILGLPRDFDGREGDHKNGDRADNRRENLRILTVAQNRQNRRDKPNATGVKHVWYRPAQGYVVCIRANRKLHYLGTFKTLEEAAVVATEGRRRLLPFATNRPLVI